MRGALGSLLADQVRRRWSLISTAALISTRPSAFAERLSHVEKSDLGPPVRFFLASVGIVLAIETAFSLIFRTAFSDLVHHLFPVLVALTGGVAVYFFLKILLTRNVSFAQTMEGALYVGATALLVMISAIFVLLTADFSINFDSVMASGCSQRTIMCLLSGNTQAEYGLMQEVRTTETQGWSFKFIVAIILAALVYYTHVLSIVLKRRMGVARWRTYAASVVSVVLLSPVYLFLLNAIYRALF